jgi:nucleolar complex protein 3
VLLAALDILRGQGESLTIDRRAILSHLYGSLLLVPLQPLYEPQGGNGSSKGRGGDDSDSEDNEALHAAWQSVLGLVGGGSAAAAAAAGSGGSGDASAGVPTSVLLARALEAQLLGSKQSDAGRLAAFVKRLVGLLLHAPTGEALGAATVAWRAGRRYGRLAALLEWEGGAPVGGVAYDADATDPSEAGGLAGALWELPLAVKHYHPHVAAAARALLQLGPGTGAAGAGGTAAIIGGAAGPQEVAAAYEVPRHGGFRPAPPQPPRSAAPSSNGKARGRAAAAVRQAAAVAPLCEELQCVVDSSAVSAGPDIGDVAAAAAAHYDLTLQHSLNQRLRRQALLEARRLELFEQHLKTRGSRNDAPNAAGGRLNFAQALQRSGRVTKHSRTAPIT